MNRFDAMVLGWLCAAHASHGAKKQAGAVMERVTEQLDEAMQEMVVEGYLRYELAAERTGERPQPWRSLPG